MALRFLLLFLFALSVLRAADYEEVAIANAVAKATISTQRAALLRLELLTEHPIRLPKHLDRGDTGTPDQPLAVLAPFFEPATPEALVNAKNVHGWLANDMGSVRRWGLTGKDFAPWSIAARSADAVTLTLTTAEGLAYSVTWRMDDKLPRVSTTVVVRNGSAADITLNPSVVPINGIHQDYAASEVVYLTAIEHRGGEEAGTITKHAVPAAGGALTEVTKTGAGIDFVGLKSRFFAVWWAPGTLTVDAGAAAPTAPVVPEGATGPGGVQPNVVATVGSAIAWRADIGGYSTRPHNDHQGFVQITYGPAQIPVGRSLTASWYLSASGMTRGDLAVFGKFGPRIDLTDWMHRTFIIFTTPLVWVLDQIVWLVPNYAIAVILLTFLVKAAMFRLTWKQHASMIAMQKVAPELKYLQEQYKGDRQKLAQKQMELWKKHGVNPLGGCLPLLVQIPIFIALYNAFQYNADMRGEHFLWISDLTLPDQIWGTPIAMLHGWVLSLNPLPIIYIGVTVWMSLTSPMPTGGDPQQEQIAKMMRWMPVMFGLIFYNMPAGLVLYFTVNAIISTLEVKFIRKRLAH